MTVEEVVDTEHSVVDGDFVPGYMKSPRDLGKGIGRVGKGHWDECGACQRQNVLVVKFNPENLTQKARKDYILSLHPLSCSVSSFIIHCLVLAWFSAFKVFSL